MTALDASLRAVDVGYDRDRYGARGPLLARRRTSTFDARLPPRRAQTARARSSARSAASRRSCCGRSTTPPTDVDADGALPGQATGSRRLGYYGLVLRHQGRLPALGQPVQRRWRRAATPAQMALAPDNHYNEFGVSAGWYGLPWQHDGCAVARRLGQGHAGHGLPARTRSTRNIATDPLPISQPRRRDGACTRADLTVTLAADRPAARCAARRPTTSATTTRRQARVHLDRAHRPVPGARATASNPVYGFERLRLFGSADFEVYDDARPSASGGEYRDDGPHRHARRKCRSEDAARRLGPRAVPAERLPRHRAQGRRRGARAGQATTLDVAADNGQNPLHAQVQHGLPVPQLRRAAGQRRASARCRSRSAPARSTATTATTASGHRRLARASTGATAST
ncbi:MAG: hypothetical protein MZV65_31360 [Chromatiales bacterium]|nr:hypothetical protein [Chromatiales bacterium]